MIQRKYLFHFIVLLIFAGIGALNIKLNNNYIIDPDRYYHFAVSRQMNETSSLFLRTIPQIKSIHWDEYFPDKEFLFHQFTGLGYRIAGESGAAVVIWLVALVAVFLLYLFAASQMATWLAFCLTFALTGWGFFLSRLCLLRPQVPAILFFTILLHGIYRRSRWHCLFATALMALSYHGLFIPFTPIILATLTFLLYPENKANERAIILWSTMGLVVGVLMNPYFPSNLVLGWIHARIPYLMRHDLAGVSFGSELYPFTTSIFKDAFVLPTLILFAAVFSMHKIGKTKKMQQDKILFTLTAAAFFVMAIESPRGAEYWVPTSVFLASILYSLWEDKKKYAGIAILASVLLSVGYYNNLFHLKPVASFASAEKIALEKISHDKKQSFIFNYEWDITPYILYYRPDLDFVDILDPSLLYFTDKETFWARQKLTEIQSGDPYSVQKNLFKADYAITKFATIADVLRRDPDFLELYPGSQKQKVQLFIYQLRSAPSPNFLHEFSISAIHNISGENFREKTPANAEPNPMHYSEEKSAYLDLSSFYHYTFKQEILSPDINCARVDIEPTEMKKFIGADYFGVGGGRNIRIWRNGKPFYTSVNGFGIANRLNLLVHMSEPLKATDQFSIIACSAGDAPYWGVSASFWTKKQIEAICEEKHKLGGNIRPDPFEWQYTGVSSESCLGAIISPDSTKLTHD